MAAKAGKNGNKKLSALTGNEAVAHAMRQINPDVVAAYPITPATEIVQIFSSFVANGQVHTEYVAVESEHSAMSATIGACAAGARAMTATSSQGLALMWEMLYIAAGLRLPIVMPVTNRALSAPINIHCDHSDTMGARDAGWIQLFSENSQEAYDNTIQAIRICEHPDILLPAMVTYDGFIISHAMEVVRIEEDAEVKEFVGEYKPDIYLLNTDKPVTMGGLDFTDFYFEHRRGLADPVSKVKDVVLQVGAEFKKQFGREYGLFETYKLDDAEYAIVVLGSTAGTAKVTIDDLRDRGVKAGMVKIRMFRPFPYDEVAKALEGKKAVAVLDRSDGLAGRGGPVFGEVRNALCDWPNKPVTVGYVYGLGGRDIGPEMIESVYTDLQEIAKTGKALNLVKYLGVRE
ncbi:MAG: pyruvate ferredoxin oxidoreductase [Armatimonadota bacterium]|nr:pyruvate ferredoxin oxidoreductase [Armatimonadota bacterium]